MDVFTSVVIAWMFIGPGILLYMRVRKVNRMVRETTARMEKRRLDLKERRRR